LQKLCREPTTPTKFMLWLYSSIFEILWNSLICWVSEWYRTLFEKISNSSLHAPAVGLTALLLRMVPYFTVYNSFRRKSHSTLILDLVCLAEPFGSGLVQNNDDGMMSVAAKYHAHSDTSIGWFFFSHNQNIDLCSPLWLSALISLCTCASMPRYYLKSIY
jgi:hypothetical protein